MNRLSVIVVAATACGLMLAVDTNVAGQAKPFVRVTEEQARAAATMAGNAAKGNVLTFESTFQKEIRKIWDDFDNATFKVYERPELVVAVLGPVEMLYSGVREQVRNRDAVEPGTWTNGVVVMVTPGNGDAPDIVRIQVLRGGKDVMPVRAELTTREMMGLQRAIEGPRKVVHEGFVLFPLAAFDPGENVEVKAFTAGGRDHSKTLFERDLRKLQ